MLNKWLALVKQRHSRAWIRGSLAPKGESTLWITGISVDDCVYRLAKHL